MYYLTAYVIAYDVFIICDRNRSYNAYGKK